MRNFIKNQMRYHKRRVLLHGDKRNRVVAKNITRWQNVEEKNDLTKREQIVNNIVIWSDN